MTKRLKRFIGIAALFSVLTLSAVGVYSSDTIRDMFDLGQKTKEMQNNNKVSIVVNDSPIYQRDIDAAVMVQDFSYHSSLEQMESLDTLTSEQKQEYIDRIEKSRKQRDDIMEDMIQRKLIEQKCVQLNITGSLVQAEKVVRDMHKLLQDSVDSGEMDSQSAQSVEMMKAYMEGLGLTEEEYIQQYEIPTTQYALMRETLMQWFIKEKGLQAQPQEIQKQKFNEYLDELKQDAEIKVY